jgi:hypothetical protein
MKRTAFAGIQFRAGEVRLSRDGEHLGGVPVATLGKKPPNAVKKLIPALGASDEFDATSRIA